MSNSELPADVDEFMDHIGRNVEMSGVLAWEERQKIKAYMTNEPQRWPRSRVSPEALRNKCQAVGLTDKETAEVVEWLRKIQEGRKLRPHRRYRGFSFRHRQEPT